MDHLVSTAAFTPTTLQSFKCCWLYMHCLSLADLSTGKGNCLHPPFYTRFPPSLPAISSGLLSTPLQPIGLPGSLCSSKSSVVPADTCSPPWATGSTHPIAPAPSCTMTLFPRLCLSLAMPVSGTPTSQAPSSHLPVTEWASLSTLSPHPLPASASHWVLMDDIGLGPLFALVLHQAPSPTCHGFVRSWRTWVLAAGPYSTCNFPPMVPTWLWLSYLAMAMASVMVLTGLVSAVIWELLHGFWRIATALAYTSVMAPSTALVALESLMPTGQSSRACMLCS